jgi:hypothetical protein
MLGPRRLVAFAAFPLFPMLRKPCVNAPRIVGAVRSSVINPAAATAPAPIGLT